MPPSKVDHWLQALGRALLPLRCLVCRERGAHGDLCAPCRDAMPAPTAACPRCARPLPAPAPACGRCLRRPPPWQAARAAFDYGFPIDRLLPRFKFHGDLAAGHVLADLWRERLPCGSGVRRDGASPPGAVVPVPLHRTRLRERGYDQALELARALAPVVGVPIRSDALWRPRATTRQSELTAGARRRNVAGAFAVRGPPLPAHVALLDDVMTTGATLRACTQALRAAGVARVDVWVLARAEGPT